MEPDDDKDWPLGLLKKLRAKLFVWNPCQEREILMLFSLSGVNFGDSAKLEKVVSDQSRETTGAQNYYGPSSSPFSQLLLLKALDNHFLRRVLNVCLFVMMIIVKFLQSLYCIRMQEKRVGRL